MDLYRPLLAKALFPAFEAARGRPTVPLLHFLQETERWPVEKLRDRPGIEVLDPRRVVSRAESWWPAWRQFFF